jgi:diguanylate cyclase (GGDEF)-like protein/PAS domain S-box-containing protein
MKLPFYKIPPKFGGVLPNISLLLMTVSLLFSAAAFFCLTVFIADAREQTSQTPVVPALLFVFSFVAWLAAIRSFVKSAADRVCGRKNLLESEAVYRVVTESASDAIITIDRNQTILFTNAAAEKIFGYAPDELIGKKLSVLIPERLRAAHAAGMQRYEETGRRNINWKGTELPALHRDGREILIEISFGEYFTDGEHYFTAVVRDITERQRATEIRRKSEQYENLFRLANDAILIIERENEIILDANEKAYEIYGFRREDFIGLSLKTISADVEYGNEQLQRLLENGGKWEFETEQRRADGTPLYLLVSASLIEYNGREAILSINRDITERKRAIAKIKEREEWLQTVLVGSRDSIVIEDGERIIYVNDGFTQLLDYDDTKELIGKNTSFVLPPEEGERLAEYGRRRLRGETVPSIYEFKTKKKDGSLVDVEGAVSVSVIGGKKLIMTAVRDITDRKLAERAVRASEERFRSFVETTNDRIWETDREGVAVYNNPAVERILGYAPEELYGKHFLSFMYEEDRAQIESVFSELIAEKRGWSNFVCRWRHKDGSLRYLESNIVPILDEAGELIGYRGTDHDITKQKQTENALRRSQSALDATRDGVFMFAPDTLRFFYVNSGAVEQVGYSREELLQMTPLDIKPEFTEETFRKMIAPLIEGVKDSHFFTTVHRHRDGRDVPVEIILQYVASETGENLFVAMVRDITERKRTAETLRENFSLLASTFEATADGILVVDLKNNIKTFNQKFIEMWDLSGEAIKKLPSDEVIARVAGKLKNPEIFKQRVAQSLKQPEATDYVELELLDGRIYERYSHPQMIEGKVVGRVLSFRNITERRNSERALRESEERFRSFMNNNPAVAFLKDENGRYVFGNKTMERTFRINMGDLTGKTDFEWLPEKVARELWANDRKILESNQATQLIETVPLPDGRERKWLSFKFPVSDASGKKYIGGAAIDITEREQAKKALQQSRQMLQLVMDTIPQAIWWKDRNCVYVGCNRYLAQLAGFDAPEQLIGLNDHKLPWTKAEADFYVECDRRIMETGVAELGVIETLSHADGKQIWLETNKVPLQNAEGEIVGILGTFKDITEQRRADAALRESEYKLRTLLDSMSEGLVQVGNDETIEFVNNRFCEMTGFSREDLLGKVTLDVLFDEEGKKFVREANRQRANGVAGQYELRLKKKTGEFLYVIVGGAPIINADGEVTGSMGVFTDITERKRAEEQLLHDAFHDSLTGLANRALFMEHLQMVIARARRNRSARFAVLFLDFDRFKMINDSLGHTEGDNLLKQIAARLASLVRPGDLVARLGGDEFTILLNAVADERDITTVAERIQEDLKTPFQIAGREIFISASIGIADSVSDYESAEEVLRDADIAMYRAKAKGKAQYQVFDHTMREQASSQLQIETGMRRALERREFEVHYQPIFRLDSGQPVGFESLVRWRHPSMGLIPPIKFIPAAEESGLILPLGNYILRESCRQLREWQEKFPHAPHLSINVNLSTKQFSQPDLVEQIAAALEATKLNPRCLKLEITESHIMDNSEQAIVVMNRLRALGVELSLDDFGTGYSSLSYLHRLPVNYLKIDRSFVTRMTDGEENSEIVSTIIKLAQNLKMSVVAEGIETAEQLAHLRNLNCAYGQGYYFSKPLEAKSATALIENLPVNFIPNSIAEQPTENHELIG